MFATKEQVAALKERALQWQAAGYDRADPLIPAMMDKVLQFEGIAPVFSCEGHTRDVKGGRPMAKRFYMMFAVEETAFPMMQTLYSKLQQRLLAIQFVYDEQWVAALRKLRETNPEAMPRDVVLEDSIEHSSITGLALCFHTRSWPSESLRPGWYDCMILGGHTSTESSKKIFFQELHVVLDEILAEQKDTWNKNLLQTNTERE